MLSKSKYNIFTQIELQYRKQFDKEKTPFQKTQHNAKAAKKNVPL